MPVGQKRERQLTIIVPAYQAERYLKTCLDSMAGRDDRLEILVIDDGSLDRTGELADQYAADFPEQVRVIHKENGGHGSGINVGARQARGRYFKVIDADDWIVTKNLSAVLDRLERSTADAAAAGFHEIDMTTGRRAAYSSVCSFSGREVGTAELLRVYDEIRDCFSFHGLFYRTDWYCSHQIQLLEGVFYEDQEYATLPFAYLDRLLVMPEFFYQYMVGNSSQSVSYQNQVKRIGHIEAVLQHMVRFYQAHPDMGPERKEYFLRRLTIVAVSYFATALVKNPDRGQGRADAGRIRSWLAESEPELARRTEKKYRALELAGALRLPPALYQRMLTTGLYQKIRRAWTK